jgi:hypothetical protein
VGDPVTISVDDGTVDAFRRHGYAVLRSVFDARALLDEMEQVFADAFTSEVWHSGSGGVRFASVPMMSRRTPTSVALADACSVPAARLIGRAVLPGRAKGTWYLGGSEWHRDSDLNIPSLAFVAYLEPLRRGHGAFAVRANENSAAPRVDSTVTFETEPGDVIIFDEHTTHGSVGGTYRRQWRSDFIADPESDDEVGLLRRSFEHIFAVDWDGGYDADRYPSYGDFWQATHRQWAKRLEDLGVIDLAEKQAAVMRRSRSNGSHA